MPPAVDAVYFSFRLKIEQIPAEAEGPICEDDKTDRTGNVQIIFVSVCELGKKGADDFMLYEMSGCLLCLKCEKVGLFILFRMILQKVFLLSGSTIQKEWRRMVANYLKAFDTFQNKLPASILISQFRKI